MKDDEKETQSLYKSLKKKLVNKSLGVMTASDGPTPVNSEPVSPVKLNRGSNLTGYSR